MVRAPALQTLDTLERLIAARTDHADQIDQTGRSDGVGAEALLQALGPSMQRRTLQRRLAELLAQGRIQKQGEARAVRYRSVPVPRPSPAPGPRVLLLAESDLPQSDVGRAIQAHVRQARQMRMPVGYQVAFLEQYHPNHSAYLPPELREQLHTLGRSPATQNSANQAPAGTFARDILSRLLIDLSWASSHLEGNTYSRLDTERLIELGQAAEGKGVLETQMILNHKQAIEYLVHDPDAARLSPETLIALHALLSDGLMADPAACGRLRRRAVEIGGSVYLPVALPQRVEDLFDVVVQMAIEIVDPFEQAFFLMVHLPYLQPFEDVNKRVSRLAANIPFIQHNLCPLSFIDVPQQAYVDAMLGVYELNRIELLRDLFVWAYERSCQRYVAVQQNLVPPDIFRLRHRQALRQVVAAIVRARVDATEPAVQAHLPASVPAAEQAPFVRLVLQEFAALHPGNAVRFGIRPLDWAAWRDRKTGES